MSNEFAIAAVTRTLRNLLNQIISADFSAIPADTRPTAEITITTLPLDKVRNGDGSRNQVNLFLYHAQPNTAWRNMDVPRRVRPGESGHPPLALDLFYLITAYGQDDSELIGHLLLGMAISILHDHPLLSRAEIESALAASDLHQQIERIRINPQPTSLDETSKLWTGFQTEYRLSAAYQVSVVLIDSKRPTRTPLPVLRRGSEDQGVFATAAPSPTLRAINLPNHKPSAEFGDILTIEGDNLRGELTLRLSNEHLPAPVSLTPLPGGNEVEMQLQLPDTAVEPQAPSQWAAGFYTLAAVVQRPNLPTWTTNALSFALAPQVLSLSPGSIAVGALPAALTLTCIPQIRPEQNVALLFANREIAPDSVTTPPDPTAVTTLTFTIDDVPAGGYVARLRVDGADSIPVVFSDTAPPQFDDAQKVTITP
jgi:hypothetical protein